MGQERFTLTFSDQYAYVRALRVPDRSAQRAGHAAEDPPVAPVSESLIQCLWYDQAFLKHDLRTDEDRPLRVLSPGWWNHGAGPDFRGAQLDFAGTLRTGDVEIHLAHGAWTQHGHYQDPAYNDVLLVVALESEPPIIPPMTAAGRRIPVLLLPHFLTGGIEEVAQRILMEDYPSRAVDVVGRCALLSDAYGARAIGGILNLAGEWRILSKARLLRERMERAGPEQAIYEAFMAACGFTAFKHEFRTIAGQLHYDRVRQLGQQDPLLVETALFQLAGLLPDSLPAGAPRVPHFERLHSLRDEKLTGLRRLAFTWRRVAVRPVNYPERRLAGAARFLARTAAHGLFETLESVWATEFTPLQRRRAFENLFPGPTGFWATHCVWEGKEMKNPTSLLGSQRVRTILGNVFIPAALALARKKRDRRREEQVLEFLASLPPESDNRILKVMVSRVLRPDTEIKVNFRMQQGLLQLYQDWCEANPSCHHCSVVRYLSPEFEP